MNLSRYTLAVSLCAAIMLAQTLTAQHVPSNERGDARYRRKAQMEGNQIRATVFNYGMTGREGAVPITEQTPYEWPKNTGQVYLAVQGIAVGAEVVDNNGETQRIVSRMHYLSSPEGETWNFEPVPGYFNESLDEGFATSDDPDTWPDVWPDRLTDVADPGWSGKWNGYFGKDIQNADQEMYFHASDNNYDRYGAYFPDTTDLTRKGLGLILDVRVMAWSQILVQDALYILYKIKNDGTEPLSKVGVTILWADFVDQTGTDDISEFDLLNDIAWSRDRDMRAPEFGNDPVGIVGGAFLETPGNSIDRIDNDGDGELLGPKVTDAMLVGESDDTILLNDIRRYDGVDNNGNGLIDESKTHTAFGDQIGVSYADGIDQNGDAEGGSPVVTQAMVDMAATDTWRRWPANPASDAVQNGAIHLIMVESDDIGLAYMDGIDNDGDAEPGSPVISQAMVDLAALDAPYYRVKIAGTSVILFDVKAEDLGASYADGVDNDDDGAVDEGIDEGIDEMIDESRSNGIDDDGEWNAASDDVGLDGVGNTGDVGEGDGQPTSGARFGLPGEPNVDVTDVSETDQIGITGSFYRPSSEWIDVYTDNFVWYSFMVPGTFFDPALVQTGDYNLFISSGIFPLQPGQTEPISMAVILANGPLPDPNGAIRKQEVLRKRVRAQETYNNDYQFANAPVTPKLVAIPGDNRVTLYWDDIAESGVDRYIENIGGIGRDFEGYRIYRSSDPAFRDALQITNASGTPKFRLPIAQFDLVDGIVGYDSVGFEGTHFYLGDDSGLQHSFIDSSVQNGFTYYYAITSYDFGYVPGRIIPSECDISVALNPDGSVRALSQNVVRVTPEAPSAGYVPATLGQPELVQGTTAGRVLYDIVDPNLIREGHVYHVTFQDTILPSTITTPPILTTKTFTLTDSTTGSILIDRDSIISATHEYPITDGFRLSLVNSKVELITAQSKWNASDVSAFTFEGVVYLAFRGTQTPYDYTIMFDNVGVDTSKGGRIGLSSYFRSRPVNFKVYNNSKQAFIDFIFVESDTTGGLGKLSTRVANNVPFRDYIVFSEKVGNDSLLTWWFYLGVGPDTVRGAPSAGDTATIRIRKPFLSDDRFRFVAQKATIDQQMATEDLSKVRVVPNPYLANALWEAKNPYTSGRGPRSIHFTHLPSVCTIRIFTITGELVREIEHNSAYEDGSAEWDLLTKDRLSVSYGIYIFHVDAPGIGTTSGKFAIIK